MNIINISFSLDILKELITGYFNMGLIVLDHKLIAKRYFNELFIYDFLGIFPFINTFMDSDTIVYGIDFFIFLKTMTLSKKIQRVNNAFAVHEVWQYYAQLIQLVSNIFMLSHIMAAMYHGIA
jgi:hypothetical protein